MKKLLLPAIIFITLLSLIPLTAFWFSAFNLSWYQTEFNKLNVYQHFEQSRVIYQTQNLFDYLAGKNNLQKIYYTDWEILHLADIKNILAVIKIITAAMVVIFVLALFWLWHCRGFKRTIKNIFWASGFGFIFYLFFAIFLFFFFDQFFLLFHEIMFRNNYWLLDPAKESLIVIFSPELFADLGFRILISSLAASGIIFIVSGFCLWRLKILADNGVY